MGSDGARVTLPVEKGKRGARAICRSELASRCFDLGEPLAAFVPRQRLQDAEGGEKRSVWIFDCFAAGRGLAVLVNCYREGRDAVFVGAAEGCDLFYRRKKRP